MEYIELLKNIVGSGFVAIPVVTYGFVQAVKLTGKVPTWALPLVSFGIGVVTGIVISFLMKDMAVHAGGIIGLVIAGFTSSVYDAFRGVQKVKERSMLIESSQLAHYEEEEPSEPGEEDE